ncbi:lysophosphatidic acid receptor 6-like [Acipenser ruthenus]|uniref:lysophosphatidic acid receptor 6-like n=1 Tax=Acipenser ruthenus TaxID=7906 RepID=UPI00145A8FDA|nr:lysophosphatidic acid receptor 6-like [Acipenser ruthenus]
MTTVIPGMSFETRSDQLMSSSLGITLRDSGNASTNSSGHEGAYECRVSFQSTLLPVVYSLLFVLSLLGNFTALTSLLKNWRCSSQATAFTLNLIIIDVLFTLSLPLQIYYYANGNNWIFGEFMCKTTSSLFFANIYGCTMFLTCICMDRYIAVMHPIKYLKLQRPVYRALVSFVIWLVIAIVVLTYAFSGRTANRFADGKISCMENFGKKSWSGWLAPIAISSSIAGFFLPFFSIVTCYSLIARRIMGMTQGKQRGQHVKKKSLRTILVVLGVLIISFLPFHVVQILHTLARIQVLPSLSLLPFTCGARTVVMGLACLNSSLDPVVYYFSAENFQLLPFCHRKDSSRSSESTSNNKL